MTTSFEVGDGGGGEAVLSLLLFRTVILLNLSLVLLSGVRSPMGPKFWPYRKNGVAVLPGRGQFS